jgi:tRNA1Val (adenine37-N6)-methyltransferase
MGKSGNRLVQFKQFTVRDDRCAMKIGTDALLLGAWSDVIDSKSILDIGSGSGIISLMLAQRAERAEVVGIELDTAAFDQCSENFGLSPFAHRMKCVHQSIQEYSSQDESACSFDTIVSNPPFFHNKPKSPDSARNLARHDDALPLRELLDACVRCLKPAGKIILIWPSERREELLTQAKCRRLHLIREMNVYGSSEHDSTRFLSEWSFKITAIFESERLNISSGNLKTNPSGFSSRYTELLRPYVLAFS